MKKKYFYLLSFLLPITIFFIIASLCGYIPFGDHTFNIYDSYYQYPTFLVELGNMLRSGKTVFYTLHAGLGVNFFSILNLYAGSPLNLLSIFFNNINIYIFYAILIYLKIGLAGLTMSIYLNSLNTKYKYTKWNIIFSLIYALSSYAVAMCMHIMWLDAYILLPLIIKGLDKLIKTDDFTSYTLFLALAIIINYYTGFMLCIFMIIYFFYKTLTTQTLTFKKFLRFILSSFLAALLACIILIPTIFNLLGGRLSNLDFTFNYFSIDWYNLLSELYNMTIGSFIIEDHFDYGTTTIYITIFGLVLLISYFFNEKISKKNKIITIITLIFFYLCFAIPLLDYAWNMFQKPYWWEHRYQFVYVFLAITIAYESFCKSDGIKISKKMKSIMTIVFMILLIGSFSYKVEGLNLSNLRVLQILLSVLLFYIYLVQEKQNKWLIILIILELGCNTYSILDINQGLSYEETIKNNTKTNENLKGITNDYRTTTLNYSDAGLMHNFNSIELFSSSNNSQVIQFLSDINLTYPTANTIILYSNNPAALSLLGVKYIMGTSDYFSCKDNLCINEQALPIIFSTSKKLLDVKMGENKTENINNIYSAILGEEINLYYDLPIDISLENVKLDDEGNFYDATKDITITLSTKVNKDCLIIHDNNQILMQEEAQIFINEEEYEFEEGSDYLIVLHENDTLKVTYQYQSLSEDAASIKEYLFTALDLQVYESTLEKINQNASFKQIEDSNFILKGEVLVNDDLLLITIPYDQGLTIKVDGKEAEYFKVLDTFIGIEVEKGEHTIEITYFPKGLKLGIFISITSLIFLLIYTKIKISKKKGRQIIDI